MLSLVERLRIRSSAFVIRINTLPINRSADSAPSEKDEEEKR